MNDRTPPHDQQAEQSILGHTLNQGRIPETAEHLTPTDFYRPENDSIWRAMQWLGSHGKPCDIVAVRARLQESQQLKLIGDNYLLDLLNGPVVDPAYVAGIITDRAMRRGIIAAHTRGLQQAYESDAEAEAILEFSETALARVAREGSEAFEPAIGLEELLENMTPAPDWVLENYLARGERMIITGTEGLGKSTWLRQMAICAAAGMDPFTGRWHPAMTVLAVDVENPGRLLQQRYSELQTAIRAHGKAIEPGQLRFANRPEGIDLSQASDRRWLAKHVRQVNPDLLVIGPAYKLYVAGNEDKDETVARTVISVLDELRTESDCALILEHHAGNETGGGARPVRPYGSSLWRRWPEFGYGIRPARHTSAVSRRLVEVVAWRGPRDERAWPKYMESGGVGMPWIAADPPASGSGPVGIHAVG